MSHKLVNVDPKKVFVVHGRNEKLVESLFSFLTALKLEPIKWTDAITLTGKPSSYIGEIIAAGMKNAQAALVLLSGDDEAKLKEEFWQGRDPEYERELTPQARPNVLFEAGMAVGKYPDRTILVEVGNLRKWTDIEGRHVTLLDNSENKRHELANKLRDAGCAVNLQGKWKKAGNFEVTDNSRKIPANPVSKTIRDSIVLLQDIAQQIREIAFPHRRTNPISLQDLLAAVNSRRRDYLSNDEFKSILQMLSQNNLLPGIFVDKYELFVIEEHYTWKQYLYRDRKEVIARRTADLIQDGMKIFLDAGSTTWGIASLIRSRIETKAFTRITIATFSVDIANMLSMTNVHVGASDPVEIKLYVPGGNIRLLTQAIVPLRKTTREILQFFDSIGRFDIGIVGVNGVDSRNGFSTHNPLEVLNKKAIIKSSEECYIVGDSSKIGLTLEGKFASFNDDIHFIVDNDKSNEQLRKLTERYGDKIILA